MLCCWANKVDEGVTTFVCLWDTSNVSLSHYTLKLAGF